MGDFFPEKLGAQKGLTVWLGNRGNSGPKRTRQGNGLGMFKVPVVPAPSTRVEKEGTKEAKLPPGRIKGLPGL